jgi:hypothetical protein
MKSKISMKIAFTKPTRMFTVPGFSNRERPELVVAVVAFAAKNLNVEFVKFVKIDMLLPSPMIGFVKLIPGKLELSNIEEFEIGIIGTF